MTAREEYLTKNNRKRGRKASPAVVALPKVKAKPPKKTTITVAELARLRELLAEARKLNKRLDQIVEEGCKLTGDWEHESFTFDALVANQYYSAEKLAAIEGLEIEDQ